MLKMQKNNYHYRRNVATDKKYVLKKISLKFQNPKYSISCKMVFHLFFVIKCKTFGAKSQ